MAKRMNYDLSDGLSALARLFAPYEEETLVLSQEDARAFRLCVVELKNRAMVLENEVSRIRWNTMDTGITEAQAALDEVLEEALSRPGNRVVRFPGARHHQESRA